MSQLYAQFQVGNTVTGTIRKHLKDNKGRTYALLVALVERHVTGILYVDKLDQVHPAMFEFFYKVDAPLEVTVTKNDMQGRISLIQNMEE